MKHKARSFWGIGWRTPFLVPLAAVCSGILGGVYEYLIIKNPWGIANIVAFFFAVFALGFIMYATARLSKLRNTPVAWILGTGLAFMFLLVATVTAYYASPLGRSTGVSLTGFLAKHRAAGLPMFNGGYALSGIWLLIVWILGVICIWLVPASVGSLEASRPFCEECKTWGYTPRWKFIINAPGHEGVAILKKEKTLTAVLHLRPGGKPGNRIECDIGACKCGRIASLAVGLYKSRTETTITDEWPINDMNMTPRMLLRLFSWAEGLDPAMVARRPMLAVAELAKVPFEVEPKPANNKYRLSTRWTAPLGASDSYVDNEYTKALRKRLKNGEFELIKAALRAQRHIEDFAYVAEACADWEGQPGWLGDWEYEKPDSATLHLIRGINSIKRAWQARGSGWVPKNHEQFHQLLREADVDLLAAAERSPKDPTPWAWMIYSAKGLYLDVDVAFERLEEVKKRSRFHRPAHSFMLDYLAPKWHGSREQLMSFARSSVAAAPPGSHLSSLIAEAHDHMAADIAQEEKSAAATAYWQSPAVGTEIRQANLRCFQPGAHKLTMDTPRTRVYFAYALWQSGQLEDAAVHLREIGKSTPWGPFSPNIPFFKITVRKARRACGVR